MMRGGQTWRWLIDFVNWSAERKSDDGFNPPKWLDSVLRIFGALALMGVTFGWFLLTLLVQRVLPRAVGPWVTAALFFGGLIGALWFYIVLARAAAQHYRGQEAVRTAGKVARLSAALAEASVLSEQLDEILKARNEALQQIIEEAERWEELAKLDEDRAAAVTRLVEDVMERKVRHLDRMGWLYLVLSTVAAFLIGRYADFINVVKH